MVIATETDSPLHPDAEPMAIATETDSPSLHTDPELCAMLRRIAQAEQRPVQALVDEALREYIDRRQDQRLRRHVAHAFAASLDEFEDLYRELAR